MLDILFSTQAWALESKYFNIVKPVILKRLAEGLAVDDIFLTESGRGEKKADTPSISGNYPFVTTYQSATRLNGQQATDQVNVQVIRLRGPMSKSGGFCSYGTADIAAALKQAYKNPDVSAIVLQVDSPGGAVDGTEYLGNVVKQANKPVVAFVDGLAASAAYWVSSQADHIMMSSRTTAWVGSIGTLIMHVDQSGWLAKEGYKVTYITADASVDKVKGNSYEPLTEESIASFKKDLNIINDTFIDNVKTGRGSKLKPKSEHLFTGKLFNGNEAIVEGLADSTGTLEDAINKAAAMARRKTQSQSPNSQANTIMKFPKLSALFGQTEASAESEVTEVQAAEAEKELTAKEDQIASLQAQITEKDDQIKALNDQLTNQQAEHDQAIEALNAQIKGKENEITTLENWRKEHEARDTRQADKSNTLAAGTEKKKEKWEEEAEKRQAAYEKTKAQMAGAHAGNSEKK